MDKLLCAFFSYTHYWYEVGLLKVSVHILDLGKRACRPHTLGYTSVDMPAADPKWRCTWSRLGINRFFCLRSRLRNCSKFGRPVPRQPAHSPHPRSICCFLTGSSPDFRGYVHSGTTVDKCDAGSCCIHSILAYSVCVCVCVLTLTDRASTIPSKIRGCQSGTWSSGQDKITVVTPRIATISNLHPRA